MKSLYEYSRITEMAKRLFEEERLIERLDGWFLSEEIKMLNQDRIIGLPKPIARAANLKTVIEQLPLTFSENAIFVGTQRDSFGMTYALINPNFEVDSFSGYCDPTAVFDDIVPNDVITIERIQKVKKWFSEQPYAKELDKVYEPVRRYTSEAVFFIEQVTGHTICDYNLALDKGLLYIISILNKKIINPNYDELQINNFKAMKITLEACITLAERYKKLVYENYSLEKCEVRKKQLSRLIDTLNHIPAFGARNLYEAIQCYILLWQVMCLEQSPNPYAFSVGNADRIFYKYYQKDDISLEEATGLFKHFLVFFNIGTRSWAISQNILLGGKDSDGSDLSTPLTSALLSAYYDMNLPQPILSVKLHKNTPEQLYKDMGKFMFTPGVLTPSFFNDDQLFEILKANGVAEEDLKNYAVAGCQEPLIMGKDNGNTTNSWLNLGKILELTINDGVSLLSGNQIGPKANYFISGVHTKKEIFEHIKELFYLNVQYYMNLMCKAANHASYAISILDVPFLSVFMGGLDSGYDMRDTQHQGTKYNGSGCLIHGVSVVGDSFIAIKHLLANSEFIADDLINALKNNFVGYERLHGFLKQCPKYGNNIDEVDNEVVEVCDYVSRMVKKQKNYLGNPFRPDFSSPSTHLLYGYHVGATPDGRCQREMLGYGIDPLYGEATNGLGFRLLSNFKLPYLLFNGGYASHFGIDPNYFNGSSFEEKGIEFKNKILKTLFFSAPDNNPFYLYVNVTTAETLRAVLKEPDVYAPNGVYIVRIHGTFVNFLDLSPAIQDDIIKRLDGKSTEL